MQIIYYENINKFEIKGEHSKEYINIIKYKQKNKNEYNY